MSLILHADHLITMNPNNEVIPNGAVLIGTEGRIQAVGEVHAIIAANPGVDVKRLADRLLMPGLVNTHAHSGLLRGTAEGLPVWEWLQQYIDPMHRVVNDTGSGDRLLSLLRGSAALRDDDHRGYVAFHARQRPGRGPAWASARCSSPTWRSIPDHDYFETLNTNEALIQQWHGGGGRQDPGMGGPGAHVLCHARCDWQRAIGNEPALPDRLPYPQQ